MNANQAVSEDDTHILSVENLEVFEDAAKPKGVCGVKRANVGYSL